MILSCTVSVTSFVINLHIISFVPEHDTVLDFVSERKQITIAKIGQGLIRLLNMCIGFTFFMFAKDISRQFDFDWTRLSLIQTYTGNNWISKLVAIRYDKCDCLWSYLISLWVIILFDLYPSILTISFGITPEYSDILSRNSSRINKIFLQYLKLNKDTLHMSSENDKSYYIM